MKIGSHSSLRLFLIAALLAAVALGAAPVPRSLADPSGTWTPTASMAIPRYTAEAILLPNGKAMVMGGGENPSGSVVASVELYDPATATWHITGSMNDPRRYFTATLLADRRILVVGGYSNSSVLATAELYDPATGQWTRTGSMHTPRYVPTATLLPDGRVLVAGGAAEAGGPALSSAELYDPATGQWTLTGGMQAVRIGHTATLLPDGRVLAAAGGESSFGPYLSSAELYDPTTGHWTATDSLDDARCSHTGMLLPDGRVLAAGGHVGQSGSYLSSAELYDPATEQWTSTGSLNEARYGHTATLLPDDRVLVAGGYGGASLASAELYDPATGQWTLTGSLNTAAVWRTATLLRDGRVLVAGGLNVGSNVLASAEIYTPSNPVAQLAFNPSQATICDQATVAVDLNDVSNLYGYQFQVTYDPTLVSAFGAFVNSFFDTATNATIPAGWDAACAAGVCKFAASKLEPGTPVSGSGPIAQVTFTRLSQGETDVAFSGDILSDRDANPLAHTTNTLHLVACGRATVSGVVALQGRATPIDAGTVTFTDLANAYPPTTVAFDRATGAFTANVPVALDGSSYQIDAGHGLYLANRQIHTLNHDDTYAAPATRLKGGDANNSGLIDIGDLTCIGGSFGGAPVTCGTTGSSDINTDATVNIFDLVLAGGNYDLAAPQPW